MTPIAAVLTVLWKVPSSVHTLVAVRIILMLLLSGPWVLLCSLCVAVCRHTAASTTCKPCPRAPSGLLHIPACAGMGELLDGGGCTASTSATTRPGTVPLSNCNKHVRNAVGLHCATSVAAGLSNVVVGGVSCCWPGTRFRFVPVALFAVGSVVSVVCAVACASFICRGSSGGLFHQTLCMFLPGSRAHTQYAM